MPSWAKTKLTKLMGVVEGMVGGAGVGVGWHLLAVRNDPPKIMVYAVEVGLVVTLIWLRKPKTPHSPNFNLLHTLTRCPLA